MAKRLLVALAVTIALSPAALNAQTFGATLTGVQETPPNNASAMANATVTLDPTHTQITVVMNVDLAHLTGPITASHIHGKAPRGTATGVLIDFSARTNIVNGKLNKTFTIDKKLGDDIAVNFDQYYVNVHTGQFPNGEIRGQLSALDNVLVLAADLRGTNEVPSNSSTAAGAALVTLDQNNLLTWEVNATRLQNPLFGHIHEEVAGKEGAIRVSFATGASAFTGDRLKGSGVIDADLANRIRANPAGFYVNLHTTQLPNGEIRGQLASANEIDVPVVGKATGANGENFVTDVRIFNPSFTNSASALLEYFPNTASGNPAASSIAVDIPARGTAVLNDVANSSGLNVSGIGGMRVSSTSQLAVTSTIFDDRRGRNQGTIGQFVPAVPHSSALRRGVLPQLATTTQFRTNIGIFNPNQTAVDVRLELRDPAGAIIGTTGITVQPLSLQQNRLESYFSGVDFSNRPALSLSFAASAGIDVYASNVDNQSSDQIFISAVNDPGEP